MSDSYAVRGSFMAGIEAGRELGVQWGNGHGWGNCEGTGGAGDCKLKNANFKMGIGPSPLRFAIFNLQFAIPSSARPLAPPQTFPFSAPSIDLIVDEGELNAMSSSQQADEYKKKFRPDTDAAIDREVEAALGGMSVDELMGTDAPKPSGGNSSAAELGAPGAAAGKSHFC